VRDSKLFLVFLFVLALVAGHARTALAQTDERIFYADVLDKDGAPVPDLTAKDFIIREDGQAREILSVVQDSDPLHIALLVDTSQGMRNNINDLRKAIAAFVDNTRDGALIALITLGSRPTISVPYTADKAALKKGIDRVFAEQGNGNTLLDGIVEAAEGLEKQKVPHAAIAAISGPADLSFRHYEEVLEALKSSGAALHVLTLGTRNGEADRELAVGKGTALTGGRSETVLSSMGLIPKAAQLAKQISSQYRITFARPQRLIPPKTTEVSVKNPDLKAHGMLVKTDKERQ
jgi:Ca-activated chloride channel family protein